MKKEHNLGKEVTAEIDSCPTLPIKRWRCIDLPPFNIAGSGLRFRALLIVWGFGSRSVRSFIYKQILMNSGHFGSSPLFCIVRSSTMLSACWLWPC